MKTFIAIGIPVGLLILSVISVWFVETRLIALFGIRKTVVFRCLFSVAYISGVAGLILAEKSNSPVVGGLYWFGGIIWITLIYLTLAFIVSAFVTSFFHIPASWTSGVALFMAVSMTCWGVYSARDFVVNTTEIELPDIETPLTIMHISDVHLGHHRGRDYLQKIVDATNRCKPDLVIINGDLLDSTIALNDDVLGPLKNFVAPVYFTGGNHEKYVDQKRSEDIISSMGVHILRNEIININGVQLVGLRYMKADENTLDLHPSDDKDTIESTLNLIDIDNSKASVFVHHSPVGINYMADKGADLVLSGHTHAGQVFPGTILSPLFNTFNRGLKNFANTKVFVSQGAGSYLTPMRSGSQNEINLLKISPL